MASTQRAYIEAAAGSTSLGSAIVELIVDAKGPPAVLGVVSGAGQRSPIGVPLAQRFVTRMTSADGLPLAGLQVTYRRSIGELGDFEGSAVAVTTTDAAGHATAPAFTVTKGIGPGIVTASALDPNSNNTLRVELAYRSTTPDGRDDRALQDMWWGGPRENGWGLSIAQRGDRLFSVLYAYDTNGNPTWTVFDSGGWALPGRYEHFIVHSYTPRGAPYFAYDAQSFVLGPTTGTNMVELRFGSEDAGSLRFMGSPLNNVLQSKDLVRQPFGSATPLPVTGVGGMWWGGESQAGWGISLMEQPGGLFGVWLTYDAAGERTWFVMPSGTWEDARTWSGTLYKTRGPRFFNVEYDFTLLQVLAVGTFRFRFDGNQRASFEYTAEGHAGSMAIVPQGF